jgi:anaerobic magnesium-protoporphyrin IX monomethyl ester cyclase
LVVVGGLHPTALPVQTLGECPSIDAAVQGEGELTLGAIAAHKDLEKVGAILGVTYRKKDEIIPASKPSPRPDLDALPNPLRTFSDRSSSKKVEEMGIHISRGCPYQCLGCNNFTVFGRRYRSRDPKKSGGRDRGTRYQICDPVV